MLKKIYILVVAAIVLCVFRILFSYEKMGELQSDEIVKIDLENDIKNKENELLKQMEKGYNLPVNDFERKEAETDCIKMMEAVADIYIRADKGEASNVSLADEIVQSMQDEVKKTKKPISTRVTYSNMENFESVDEFLNKCMEGIIGSVVIYEIHFDGSVGRKKFIFDGSNMYVLNVCAMWGNEDEPNIIYAAYTRIKEWKYTDKGWFCYELCVPEPPEVSEIIDGSCLIRVKPMTEEQREMSERYVLGLGYQGNNLLCSDWNTDCMGGLDYMGMYEYLYRMKYQEQFEYKDEYQQGIPKDEFENLIMEYLPVTAEQIRECAVFDEECQTYEWNRLGCLNYAPTFFGTSVPEVTDITENEDGTVTLTVDAVCEMILNDAVITHELTIHFNDDGSYQYYGNKILNNGIEKIPKYQYRSDKQS